MWEGVGGQPQRGNNLLGGPRDEAGDGGFEKGQWLD